MFVYALRQAVDVTHVGWGQGKVQAGVQGIQCALGCAEMCTVCILCSCGCGLADIVCRYNVREDNEGGLGMARMPHRISNHPLLAAELS